MTHTLTPDGYEQTKEKLANLEQRVLLLEARTDLSEPHKMAVRRSYEQMIGQYRRELKLYEASHPETTARP